MGNAFLPLQRGMNRMIRSPPQSLSLPVSVSHLLIYLRAPRPVGRGTCTPLKGHEGGREATPE